MRLSKPKGLSCLAVPTKDFSEPDTEFVRKVCARFAITLLLWAFILNSFRRVSLAMVAKRDVCPSVPLLLTFMPLLPLL